MLGSPISRRPLATALLAVGLAAAATTALPGVAHADVSEVGKTKRYDGLQELLDAEASDAMGMADFTRAWSIYSRLLQLDPNDVHALREAGRAAHALGDFGYAERSFARAAELEPNTPDPEMRYLRAECLSALNRKPEAKQEYARAEADIGPAPTDRRAVIWLGRILAVRGDLDGAQKLYEGQLLRDGSKPEHEEIMMYLVEAHILANDWAGAEKILREYLSYWPDFQRGHEMLAWVLEARGKIGEELKVRASLLSKPSARPKEDVVAYARTLERAHDYPAALKRYRQAREMGASEVTDDIDRIELRMAPEAMAGMSVRRDPSGDSIGWMAGASYTFPGRQRIALYGWHEIVNPAPIMGAPTPPSSSATQLTLRGHHTFQGDAEISAAATVHTRTDDDFSVGGTGAFRDRLGRHFQYQLSGELQMPWRESSSTLELGGVVDSGTAELYATALENRLIFSLVGRARRLSLAPVFDDVPHATQYFGAAGIDWVVRANPSDVSRGQILDHDLLWPSGMATSLVLSYRHYELTSDDPFGARLVLVERASLDEASGVFRQMLGDGAFGVEGRGGIAYDWSREARLWRAGGSILIAATLNSRLTLDYDYASESRTGLSGRRQTGLVALHVDI